MLLESQNNVIAELTRKVISLDNNSFEYIIAILAHVYNHLLG